MAGGAEVGWRGQNAVLARGSSVNQRRGRALRLPAMAAPRFRGEKG